MQRPADERIVVMQGAPLLGFGLIGNDTGVMKTPPKIQIPKEFLEAAEKYGCDPIALAIRVLRKFTTDERTHLTLKPARRCGP
jgi:hypothetical protein